MEGTPATFAGTTFMITLEASGANPPGTYKPTRLDRNHASAYDRAGRHADLASTVTELGLTDAATALDRCCKRLPQVGCSRAAAFSNAVWSARNVAGSTRSKRIE